MPIKTHIGSPTAVGVSCSFVPKQKNQKFSAQKERWLDISLSKNRNHSESALTSLLCRGGLPLTLVKCIMALSLTAQLYGGQTRFVVRQRKSENQKQFPWKIFSLLTLSFCQRVSCIMQNSLVSEKQTSMSLKNMLVLNYFLFAYLLFLSKSKRIMQNSLVSEN